MKYTSFLLISIIVLAGCANQVSQEPAKTPIPTETNLEEAIVAFSRSSIKC